MHARHILYHNYYDYIMIQMLVNVHNNALWQSLLILLGNQHNYRKVLTLKCFHNHSQ